MISGYTTDATTTTGTRTSVTQTEIGITLTVTPLIGNDGSVQLTIEQEVNDILGEILIDGNAQPRVGSRRTQSFVTVKSGEIIVLGGLQRVSDTRSTSRLGPIPFIGDLLGRRTRTDNRSDLVFFLRPVVLTNSAADNVDALQRLDRLPIGGDARRILTPGSSPEAPARSAGPQLLRPE